MTTLTTTKRVERKAPPVLIGAVIVARMNSSRLPGKSMVMIQGRPSLEWMYRRLRRSKHIGHFVFATTTSPDDDPIAELAQRLGQTCFRGSEDDVLGRVCTASVVAGLDVVVHVTGDCPLVDPQLTDAVVELLLAEDADYASLDFEQYPPGFDVEAFRTAALQEVEADFHDPWIREHVTEPLYTTPQRFRAVKLRAPEALARPHHRVCVDTPEDYELVNEIFARLLPQGERFTAGDVVEFLDEHPELLSINRDIKQAKYSCAVIGLGAVGAMYPAGGDESRGASTHAEAYVRFGKTRLLCGADPDEKRRAQASQRWRIDRMYADADKMLRAEQPAIVSIAAPVEQHAVLCEQAIEAGVRAIFCEKPFVSDADDGWRIIQLCERHGVVLQVNHWMRFSTLYRSIRDYLAEGGLGDLQVVRCHYTKGAANSGTHAVDLIRFLVGEVHAVRATERIELDGGRENLGGVLRVNCGVPAHLTVSDYRGHFSFEVDLIGMNGRIQVTDDRVRYWEARTDIHDAAMRRLEPADPPFATDLGRPFQTAISEIVNVLDSGKGPLSCCGFDGLQAVQVIEALKQSWQNGCREMLLDEPETARGGS